MFGSADVAACLLFAAIAAPAFAQSDNQRATPFDLGHAALAVHDPTRAIEHFAQIETRAGREWLAVALMMESRSASDQYVERAFDAAARSRVEQSIPPPPRAGIAAALHSGDMVIAFLVGETAAYGWAFDRDGFVGYQLPPPAAIATAVARATAYRDQNDREGLQRIADDLLPALLGPAQARLSHRRRVIFVVDGRLKELPLAALSIDRSPGIAVATTDYASLMNEIARDVPAANTRRPMLIGAVTIAVLLIAGIAAFWKRQG